jgi:hypothetical protein
MGRYEVVSLLGAGGMGDVCIDRHATALDELDVEGLWTHASLNQRQLQQLFFPDGVACSGSHLNRTSVTTAFFSRFSDG